jgi:NADH:ubiquinone oxidoreductase subunit 3 (subunit A)
MTDLLMDIVTSPLLVFALTLLVAWILYWLGGKMSPSFLAEGGKAKAYTGGENIPGKKQRVSYQFYHLALIFTVLHVTTLVVATAFLAGAGIAAIFYLLIGTTAVVVVLVGWQNV